MGKEAAIPINESEQEEQQSNLLKAIFSKNSARYFLVSLLGFLDAQTLQRLRSIAPLFRDAIDQLEADCAFAKRHPLANDLALVLRNVQIIQNKIVAGEQKEIDSAVNRLNKLFETNFAGTKALFAEFIKDLEADLKKIGEALPVDSPFHQIANLRKQIEQTPDGDYTTGAARVFSPAHILGMFCALLVLGGAVTAATFSGISASSGNTDNFWNGLSQVFMYLLAIGGSAIGCVATCACCGVAIDCCIGNRESQPYTDFSVKELLASQKNVYKQLLQQYPAPLQDSKTIGELAQKLENLLKQVGLVPGLYDETLQLSNQLQGFIEQAPKDWQPTATHWKQYQAEKGQLVNKYAQLSSRLSSWQQHPKSERLNSDICLEIKTEDGKEEEIYTEKSALLAPKLAI